MENNNQNLYAPNEERFGFFTSHGYSLSRIIPTFRRFYSFVISDISGHRFSRIMDIGSGNGYVLTQIIRNNPDAKGFGIDPSPYMLKISSHRARKTNLSDRLTFSLGSSHDIPFKGPFDIIYSTMSFHHWAEREKAVKDIVRLLSENGLFMIYEASPDGGFNRKFVRSHLMSKSDFMLISEQTGVKLAEIVEANGFIGASFMNA
jgi:ubiquinone/menaquinone biosynthesis C-methylase UbiE